MMPAILPKTGMRLREYNQHRVWNPDDALKIESHTAATDFQPG